MRYQDQRRAYIPYISHVKLKKMQIDAISSRVRLMNIEPKNTPERPDEVVAYWLSTLPRWNYDRKANFYEALIFLRERLIAMDLAQVEVSRWLMKQDEALLGPLKDMLLKLGQLTEQSNTKWLYDDAEEALRSRLLRSRSEGRTLTLDALMKIELQVKKLQQDLLAKESFKSDQDRKELQLTTIQIKFLLETLKENDFLYETFEPARSILNAFKQQKSVVTEILNWYQIPIKKEDLVLALQTNKYGHKDISKFQNQSQIVDNQDELFSLNVSDKQLMTVALRQAYFYFFWIKQNVPFHIGTLVSVLDKDGKVSKIGTQGHEWEAFVRSSFSINEPLFNTLRSSNKSARTFEVKLVDRLSLLEKKLQQSTSEVEATILKAENGIKADMILKPKNDVLYEIVMAPNVEVFQRITYQVPTIFRVQVEELLIELSAQIYKKYETQDFKILMEGTDTSFVRIYLDFPTDIGEKRTQIHKFVRDQLQQLRVDIDLKFDR